MRIAYHLVAQDWYLAQPSDADYLPEAFERDGFVHLTHGIESALAVGTAYYRADNRPYLLLMVDLGHVAADVRYDDPDQRYPHIYGPIDRAAIIEVHRANRAPDGSFLNVGAALPAQAQAGR
jgi:uncharacterized protein (DUF952 family)